MFTSEYSSSLACSLPFSNLVNMVRSEAISSALAFSVIRRGATSASTEEGLEWGGTPAEPEERSLLMTGIQYSRNTTVRNPAYFRVPMPGVRLDRRPGTKPGERVLDQR